MFKLVYELQEVGEYQTFQEAFKELHERLTKDIQEGYSQQMLSAIFIEHEVEGMECVLNFFDARDLAYKIGLLRESKLQEISLTPVQEMLIEAAFVAGKMAATVEQMEIETRIAQLRRQAA